MNGEHPTQRGPRRIQDVIVRDIAGEVFLVPIRGRLADLQELFVLDGVGEWVWQRLDGSHTPEQIAAELAATHEVTPDVAGIDVAEFLGELDEAGLLEPDVGSEVP